MPGCRAVLWRHPVSYTHLDVYKRQLLEWFLSQARCNGFTRAIFSGLPSVVFARVVRDIVIADGRLGGLYHVAATPIAKFDLLGLIATAYGKSIRCV